MFSDQVRGIFCRGSLKLKLCSSVSSMNSDPGFKLCFDVLLFLDWASKISFRWLRARVKPRLSNRCLQVLAVRKKVALNLFRRHPRVFVLNSRQTNRITVSPLQCPFQTMILHHAASASNLDHLASSRRPLTLAVPHAPLPWMDSRVLFFRLFLLPLSSLLVCLIASFPLLSPLPFFGGRSHDLPWSLCSKRASLVRATSSSLSSRLEFSAGISSKNWAALQFPSLVELSKGFDPLAHDVCRACWGILRQ